MHIVDDNKFAQFFRALKACFLVEQEGRDDAGDFAAGLHHALRHRAHDAACAATIDEADAMFGNGAAKRQPRFTIKRVLACGRAAINTNGSNLEHRAFLSLVHRASSRACGLVDQIVQLAYILNDYLLQ